MLAINLLYKKYFRFLFFVTFLLVFTASAWGQANEKRMLTAEDYPLWNLLNSPQISSNGNWTSYRLYYEYTAKDTLVVQQLYGKKNYIFPGARTGKFNGETNFSCLIGDTLILQDLRSGKQYQTNHVVDFAFSANQKYLVMLLRQADQKLKLVVKDLNGTVVQQVSNIAEYRFNSSGNGIVYSTVEDNLYSAEMMLFKDVISKKTVSTNHNGLIKNFVWKENSIAFIETLNQKPKLFIYHIAQDKLSLLDPRIVSGFPMQMTISDAIFYRIVISEDGEKVFFWLKENQLKSGLTDPNAVEVWNAGDKQLIGSKLLRGDYAMSDKLAVWNLKENIVFQITDKKLPSGILSADFNYAFIYDQLAYEPQSHQASPYDLYLVNLKNGERKRLIERYVFGDNLPARSPDGRYLCYAKQGHWWVYDIHQDLHTNITVGIPISFFVENTNMPREDEPYGFGGWTKDGKVILYDRYDLWKISLDGKEKTRLTKGRELQKTFRIEIFKNPYNLDVESKKDVIDIDKGLFLTTACKQNGATGLSSWNPKSGVKELVFEKNKYINQVSKAENKDSYIYLDQSFISPPRLMAYDGKPREIFRSNKQQDQFYWGKNEPIEYIVDGEKTKGILYYPAGYQAGKKYPMIVDIYERQFGYMNFYENPSLIDGAGKNVTNFTLQGYFVLYPDINYEFGNLRESITKSVLTAVDTVVAKGNIYADKIGLIGHSFGGYETDLILTQTDRFTAAVAGAAWTDVVSAYLYFGAHTMRPDFFRVENQQFRIGKSLFEDMQSYLRNSPVLLANKVKTPLLGWTGKEDPNVNSLQSMEFFLALRRASKEHTLLVYPNEGHTLDNKENATDLSVRVMQWFDYYLKNGKKQDWMKSDYQR